MGASHLGRDGRGGARVGIEMKGRGEHLRKSKGWIEKVKKKKKVKFSVVEAVSILHNDESAFSFHSPGRSAGVDSCSSKHGMW